MDIALICVSSVAGYLLIGGIFFGIFEDGHDLDLPCLVFLWPLAVPILIGGKVGSYLKEKWR